MKTENRKKTKWREKGERKAKKSLKTSETFTKCKKSIKWGGEELPLQSQSRIKLNFILLHIILQQSNWSQIIWHYALLLYFSLSHFTPFYKSPSKSLLVQKSYLQIIPAPEFRGEAFISMVWLRAEREEGS